MMNDIWVVEYYDILTYDGEIEDVKTDEYFDNEKEAILYATIKNVQANEEYELNKLKKLNYIVNPIEIFKTAEEAYKKMPKILAIAFHKTDEDLDNLNKQIDEEFDRLESIVIANKLIGDE